MKQFILKTIIFGVCCFATDRLFILLKYKETNIFSEIALAKMKKVSHHLKQKNITSVDIAIMGSSHPQFGISPEIVSRESNKSCVNLAYGGGTNVGAQFEFIKRIPVRPRVIIFALDVFSLNYKSVKGDVFQNEFFDEHSLFKGYHEDALSYSYIYLYSHFLGRYINDVKRGNYTLPYLRKTDSVDLTMFSSYNGYEITPLGWVRGNGYLNKKFLRYDKFVFTPQRESVDALKKIVDYCRENNIVLVIIQMPEHENALKYRQKYLDYDKWIRQFASDNRVEYVNFNGKEYFPVDNDSLFFDTDHLNIKGAEVFSDTLVKRLYPLVNF